MSNNHHNNRNSDNMPASMILSTLASLIPLICRRSFLGEYATDSTVQQPASFSFLTSAAAIPDAFRSKGNVREGLGFGQGILQNYIRNELHLKMQ